MARQEITPDWVMPYDDGSLSAEVKTEVDKIRMDGHPWTLIRPLCEGDGSSDGLTCDGSQGNHNIECSEKVEAVQYNQQGVAQHYCEKHALLQNDWDKIHRSKPRATPDLTPEQIENIRRIREGGKKKRKKQEEPEPLDPMA